MNAFGTIESLHFVGIGGSGMTALAELLLRQGYRISGSDLFESPAIKHLRELGARIDIGHRKGNLQDAEAVVFSSAVGRRNPELVEAAAANLPIVHRAELLSEMMRSKKAITVTGTHGKTTTSSMIGVVLKHAGLDPTIAVGARIRDLGSNAWNGSGDYFVAEADESDRSFLRLRPIITAVTGIDLDHLDEYRGPEDLCSTFVRHMNSVPFYGLVVACIDDSRLVSALRNVHRPVLTYGMIAKADISADQIRTEGFASRFRLLISGEPAGKVFLRLAGRHNIENSLAAIAVGLHLRLPVEVIIEALHDFEGTERRLEWKGEKGGVWVIDDYAHHPTEIAASLQACAQMGRRIVLVFQPHRYSRTQALMDQMADSFDGADQLYLMEIYGAGEQRIAGISSQLLADRISNRRSVLYVESPREILQHLKKECRAGDLLITMGAGDVWKIGESYLESDN